MSGNSPNPRPRACSSVPHAPSVTTGPREMSSWMSGRIAGEAGGPRGICRRHGPLGQGDRADGVLAVTVCADFFGVLLGDGRAADKDLDLFPDARLLEGVNGG